MRVDLLSRDLYDSYTAFLLQNPQSLFYYSTPYKDFLEDLLGCKPHYFLAEENGEIKGILPLMMKDGPYGTVINSLPYYGSHGGIFSQNAEAIRTLTAAYNTLAQTPDVASSTVVSHPFCDPNQKLIHNSTDSRIGQMTDIRHAGGDFENEIFKRISGNKRNEIRRARKHGVTVSQDTTALDFLKKAHQQEMQEMGRRYKTDAFFQTFPRFFEEGRDWRLYVASLEGQPIAALLLFYFNKTVEYFTPVTVPEYRIYQPMPLILYHVMMDAMEEGYHWLNWGGTWHSQEGVYRFKHQMGAQDFPYTYSIQLNQPKLLARPPQDVLRSYEGFYVYNFGAKKP